jgi:thiol-disulfide isomerase/thioredoxin
MSICLPALPVEGAGNNRINLNQAERAVAGFTAGGCPFCVKGGPSLKQLRQTLRAAEPFPRIIRPTRHRSISVYRISLVKDESVSFGNVRLAIPRRPRP